MPQLASLAAWSLRTRAWLSWLWLSWLWLSWVVAVLAVLIVGVPAVIVHGSVPT